MIGYASRTGTRRNLEALRAAGWRLVVSPTGRVRTEGFRYGLDNGAWTAHQQGTPWSADAFELCALRLGTTADWVVAPDVVLGGPASLELSLRWLPRLDHCRLVLIAVQDGMRPEQLEPHVGARVGLFVGGGTQWKETSLPAWGELARARGCYLHVGRVNSARRIRLCSQAGADSFDGSGPSRFEVKLRTLDKAARQGALRF